MQWVGRDTLCPLHVNEPEKTGLYSAWARSAAKNATGLKV
jgi:hypothetical protein